MRIRFRIRRFWHRRADNDGLPPPSRSQRALVAGAALAITLVLGFALLSPHINFIRSKRAADALEPCAPGQTHACVGGTMRVIVEPAASSVRN
jgi:hypothetical protein